MCVEFAQAWRARTWGRQIARIDTAQLLLLVPLGRTCGSRLPARQISDSNSNGDLMRWCRGEILRIIQIMT